MSNVFDKALDVMRERGMCKYTQEDSHGHVCLYGALYIAKYGQVGHWLDEEEGPLMDRVANELFPERKGLTLGAAYVNNHQDTTQEDVELILKHCSYEWDLLHG